jgi:hypothetical protein
LCFPEDSLGRTCLSFPTKSWFGSWVKGDDATWRARWVFIAKKLNQFIKAAPTNMDENSSPGSNILNQVTINRWRLSFIRGRLHRLTIHQSLKEALGLV